jgi:formylglycine-generating enzyme required for sulfatase activity
MHGNVWEMCLDWWGDPGSYTSDPVTDPVGAAEGTSRHMRGGSQANIAGECRSASRAGNGPNDRYEFVGFRVALTVSDGDDDDDDYDDGPAFAEKYMVVDLASGESSYLDDSPDGGWSDEYKTTKMVLRKVEAGKFTMGSPEDELGREADEYQHEVTLTKDFYVSVFQTTQKQYETITGGNPSEYKGDMRPVDSVSYSMIRGAEKGAGWPANGDVDEDSFLGKLRAKTSKAFDLPTEAQWEFACRAGTTTALNNGKDLTNVDKDDNLNELGRYSFNQGSGKGGYSEGHTAVGFYIPNSYGLYDMHGNVREWCLDWLDENASSDPATDPAGAAEGSRRLLRGGGFGDASRDCRSAVRDYRSPEDHRTYNGFRVVLVP